MKFGMNKSVKTCLMLATLVAVALLAAYWATSEPTGTPLERQFWQRWNLTDEQRREINQLIRSLIEDRVSWEEIKNAVEAKLDEWNVKQSPRGDLEFFYTAKAVASTVNVALLFFLLVSYVDIYSRTKSEFTLGLILFSLILLLYALVSNPIVQASFGFRAVGLGPFALLPDLFSAIALSMLLYMTIRY